MCGHWGRTASAQSNSSALYVIGQALVVLIYHAPGDIHHAGAAAEVLVQPHLHHIGIPLGKGDDVVHLAAAPLLDGLVVVAHHTQVGPQPVQRALTALAAGSRPGTHPQRRSAPGRRSAAAAPDCSTVRPRPRS